MKVLLLDLDNTLVDRDAALLQWLRGVLPSHARMSSTFEALIACDGGGHGCKTTFFEAVARYTGSTVALVRERFRRELPELVRLKRDADVMLREFPGTTIVVTNGSGAMQRRKLASAGLEGRVSHVLVSEECGLRKPSADIFRLALELAGCDADGALMVGDHPEQDIEGARAAGIDGVLVRTRWFDAPAGVKQVRALTELAW
ncbi:MAG: HAD family hydrolase [Polyangiales bacterium]